MAQDKGPKFELPGKMEKILAGLSTYYALKGPVLYQKLLVNSTYHIEEGWTYDNWNGGTYGHALHLHVPSAIYYEVLDDVDKVAEDICSRIRKVGDRDNEFVAKVFLELQDDPALEDWREKSGTLLRGPQAASITEDRVAHLWKAGFLRVFLSHKSEYKVETAQLGDALLNYGVSAFVAHQDIEPTKEWLDEIEKALFTMEVMVPLLTEGFRQSYWTDQELGVAVGRGVPIVPVRLGMDPYGFIGRYQALAGYGKSPKDLARELMGVLLRNPVTKARALDTVVLRFEQSESFNQANDVVELLYESLDSAPSEIVRRLEVAPDNNSQVLNAFRVKYRLPGLLERLRSRS